MRVTVRFDDECHEDTVEWINRSPGPLEDRQSLIETYLDEMRLEFVRSKGLPAGSMPGRDVDGKQFWWWHYAGRCWVQFTVTDEKGPTWGKRRLVRVTGIQPDSPF